MGSTPNWNIYYYSNGDPGSEITESAVQAGTIETALDQVGGDIGSVNNFGVQYFANASARDLALTNPQVGWLTQLGSELFVRRWDGAAWKPYGAGLYPVRPASTNGSGVTVTDTGLITFTSAGTFSVNGVFSSEFSQYQIEFKVDTASTDLGGEFRLRVAGVDATTNYRTHYTQGTGTTTTTAASGATDRTYTQVGTGRQILSTVLLVDPATARTTTGRTTFSGFNNAGGGFEGVATFQHTTATAYDGFSILPSSGTFSGSLRVFGLI